MVERHSGLVCVGRIIGVHGVRGAVKLKSYTEAPEAVVEYGPLSDRLGRRHFTISLLSRIKEHWLARIDGIDDRDTALALRGTDLFVERSALPEPAEDEYYHTDLIGLRAETLDGKLLGKVTAVHDFGAGTMIEIIGADAPPLLVPFTGKAVPVVDVAGGRIAIDPPGETDGEAAPVDRP
ncbi:MAG: 16S rRNA processing protein RimM [Azospirillum sp.]|nr:16S rRNA processing protein RimM [Azospirillum sp.]